jgi:hypothetical protein
MSFPARILRPAILALGLLAAGVLAQGPPARLPGLYMVVFAIAYDEKGALHTVRPARVFDLGVGPSHPVELAIPDSHVSAVRERLAQKGRPPPASKDGTVEMFAYFFFDPAQPHRVDIDPRDYLRR